MKNRNSPFYLSAIGLIIFLAAMGWQSVETKTGASATTPAAAAPMPNLSGERAKDYLAQNNLRESLGEAIQAARYGVNRLENRRDDAFEAKNPQQNFAAYFTAGGVNLVSQKAGEKWNLSLKLKSFGRGGKQSAAGGGARHWTADKTKVSALHEIESEISNLKFQITEVFENKPEGLEQSFVIEKSPKSAVRSPQSAVQPLKIVLSLGGDLQPEISGGGQALILTRGGARVLRYDKLKSWDASGRELISKMEYGAGELSLVVDDENAVYPITIDPTFTQIKKLLAADGAANDVFGFSVAVGGNTAIIGAIGDNNSQGSAYIFERNAGGANNWGRVAKLTANDGAAGDLFGAAVAASGDNFFVGAYLANSPAFTGKQIKNSFGGNATGAGYVFRAAALAPTAANVSVSGRVLTASGGGISRARVTLTDSNGETRSATTNSFGWFRFDDVRAGETFVIEIRHKKYQFAPRVLTVNEDIADLDFTAEN